jgi:ATP-dependent helicase/nuclease subunit A
MMTMKRTAMSSGPAMRVRIPDAEVRDLVVQAVDRSFIVQAPAGSGKTELLTQRFLALLAIVEHPESVLAITFTRKAASEMRIRVLEALDSAQKEYTKQELQEMEPHKARARELALVVLQADEGFHWKLLENPMRLQIRTVDSLSDSIARHLPMLAGIAGELQVTEDFAELYREAADHTLKEVGDKNRAAEAVATLLRYRDNKLSDVRDLLISMLGKRDQWLRIISTANTATEEELAELRTSLEAALRRAVEEDLKKARAQLLSVLGRGVGEVVRLARIIAGQGAGTSEVPPASAAALETWRAISELVLTEKGTIRKRVANGFEEADDRNSCRAILNALGEREENSERLCALLTKIRKLPTPTYTEDEWRFVRALLVSLPRCAAHLKLVFGAESKVDFIEMALAAKSALETDEGPTELGLALGSQIKHLLIDEFQDTSQSQLGLVNALTRTWDEDAGNTLFLVGDPMQSIYAFREAEVTIFTRASRGESGSAKDLRWPVEPVKLTANFRSQRGLVEWFNRTHSQILTRDDDATSSVGYSTADAVKESVDAAVTLKGFAPKDYIGEAAYVGEQVQNCLDKSADDSIAILVRARSHLAYIVRELEARRIKFRAVEIDELDKRQAVLDLDALARAVLDEADRNAWLSVLRAPYCGLTLADLWELCRGDRDSTVPTLLRTRFAKLSNDGQLRVTRLLKTTDIAVRECSTLPLRLVVERLWISLGGPATLRPQDREACIRDTEAYLDFLEERWASGVRPGTRQFKTQLEKLYAPAATDPSIRVELLTIHGAKGLEWDVVFLPALGRAPRGEGKQLLYWREQRSHGREELLLGPMRSIKVPDPERTIECYLQSVAKERNKEERKRLLYVATTRAKKNLYLTASLKKDGVPNANSLLALMWPVQEIANAITGSVEVMGSPLDESAKLSTVPFRRLPPEFALPAAPERLNLGMKSSNEAEDRTLHTFDWAGETRRRVGTVTHAFLQAIGREGSENWNAARVLKAKGAVRTALVTEGVGPATIEPAAAEVLTALTNAVTDDRGRWILATHEKALSEFAVTAIADGVSKRLKIDRTFIENSVRWVVDFKITQIEGGDSERYLNEQIEKYRDDLRQYAEALQLLDPDHEIRAALYFPLQKQFRAVPL